MFAFHFLRDIVFDKEERNKLYDGYYLILLAVASFVMLTVGMTMLA
jgi:hypothetical protein